MTCILLKPAPRIFIEPIINSNKIQIFHFMTTINSLHRFTKHYRSTFMKC